MAVTPNFSWPVPVATDYVKDGWEAISDLGNAIDTTVAGLGSGLTKLNTTNFTTSSGVIVDGVFSSTYNNYKILIYFTAASASATEVYWYGRSGSPAADTTTNYYHNLNSQNQTTVSGQGASTPVIGAVSNAYPNHCAIEMELFTPNVAKKTIFIANSHYINASGTAVQLRYAGYQDLDTQFTGIKILGASGTISGTLTVYGYQK